MKGRQSSQRGGPERKLAERERQERELAEMKEAMKRRVRELAEEREAARVLAERAKKALRTDEQSDRAAVTDDTRRHVFQEQKRKEKSSGEGWDDNCVIPESKLQDLLITLNTEASVLVRAPPGSGKTAMAQFFGHYCMEQGHPVYSLTFSAFAKIKKDSVDEYFREYWNEEGLRTTLSAIFDRAFHLPPGDKKPILIVDEGQAWYTSVAGKKPDPVTSGFWSAMKTKSSNLLFLCFSAFGDPSNTAVLGTPFAFSSFFNFPFLNLSLEETKLVARKMFGQRTHAPTLFDETVNQLHFHTNGHPPYDPHCIDGNRRQ